MTITLRLGQGQTETVRVLRWKKIHGPRVKGWEVVRFNDGGVMVVRVA
jgi:hypothetical protein